MEKDNLSNLNRGQALLPQATPMPLGLQPYYIAGAPYGVENAATTSEKETSLLHYWGFLLNHKVPILLSAIIGLILGTSIGVPMTPVYRARTSIEVLNVNEDFMNMKQTDPLTSVDYSDEVSQEETEAQLLQGNALVSRVGAKLVPSSRVKTKPKMASSGWRGLLHLPESVEMTPSEKLLDKAVKTLKVRVTPRTRVLEITTDSTDPRFAADFANTLVQEFILQNAEARQSVSQHTGDWLKREISEARGNLQHSEDALQAYARDSGLIFTDTEAQTNVATEKLQQIMQALSSATTDRVNKQSRFQLAMKSPPDSLADVLNDEGLQDLTGKLNDAKTQLADLSTVYNSDYSKVKRLQAQVDVLQKAFDSKRADILKRIETDYHQSAQTEKLLADNYAAQARQVTGQDQKTIQYNILKREADSNRQLYDTMLQQMKQASVAAALHPSDVRIVDLAEATDIPVFPNFKLNAALGLFAGLILSVVAITLREHADRTLQTPGDLKLWTEMQELGVIPGLTTTKRKPVLQPLSGIKEQLGESEQRGVIRRANHMELIMLRQKTSVIAEAFRSTLASILFIGDNGSEPRVLVFTSAHPGDGKTTVVSNLAVALAEIRRKVLVIDADLRRPRMHNLFDLKNERGLSDLLREELTDENLASFIQETEIPGLDVIPGGVPTNAASHLLYSPNFQNALSKLKRQYDIILIDTPPMMQITDARVIGRLADAAVLVARAGRTTRDAVTAMKARFTEDHVRILGSVLNAWDPKRAVGSYYNRPYYDAKYSDYGKYTSNAAD